MEKCWAQIKQIWVIFTHLKLWVAEAKHNIKFVNNCSPTRWSVLISIIHRVCILGRVRYTSEREHMTIADSNVERSR